MLYNLSVGQDPLYWVRQGVFVFLHAPAFGSSWHRTVEGDCTMKNAEIGGIGSGSNSHCNVTVWFSATVDGVTVKVIPSEIYDIAD